VIEAHPETGTVARLGRDAVDDLALGDDGVVEAGELERDLDLDPGRHRQRRAQKEAPSTDVDGGAKYGRVLVLEPAAAAHGHTLVLAHLAPGFPGRTSLYVFALGLGCHDGAIICSRLMYVKSVSVAVFPTFPIDPLKP
jgi:hypothetical protein